MDDDQDGDFHPMFVHRNPYYKSSKILLIAIVSLVAVVFSVLLLHIYAKYVLRRHSRRRAALHRLSLRVAAQLSMAEPPPKTGLDPLVIASLPSFIFKSEDAARPECSVCLSVLSDDDVARLLPNCNHVFHVECIDKWLELHGTCPVCRTEAEPREGLDRGGIEPVLPIQPDVEPVCDDVVGTLEGEGQEDGKCCESGSRFGSFRRMLMIRDRTVSLRRVQSFDQGDDDLEDLEIQR